MRIAYRLKYFSLRRMMVSIGVVVLAFSSAVATPLQVSAASSYVKYPWWSNMYRLNSNGTSTYMTATAYRNAGSPTVRTVGWIPGSTVLKYDSSSELFLYPPAAGSTALSHHKLTSTQWAATGYKTPVVYKSGYYKVAASTWSWYGSPTPKVLKSIPSSCV